MPNFTYNRNLPDSPNNPSVDQPTMKVNTNSNDDLLNVDHFSYNDNNGGLHKQLTMINQTTPGFPNGGNGLLFAGVNSANSWPHWQNSLGTVVLVNGVPSAVALGYTYLAGGILMNWGRTTTTGTTTTVTFGKAFQAASTPFSIVLTVERAS